ncbi:PIN domain nuclease [Fibrella aestuarina]|uniref:Ribonuclease VapC n=1 Tax=Fibrivirga algicola TaxID=2950420 RepID=A0ABX0QLZ2_9BACT|nr:twitching motility protein PilT [Fibrella sp. ES10-3-2-2]NID11818.1 PIN domain nuclease [Fibrivirga algicola]
MLVDTTVWIDWFKGIDCPQTNRVAVYLRANHPIWVAPVIVQETLQGIRDEKEYELIKTSLLALNRFQADAFLNAIGAADLYRALRKKGVTIRKANDCLIAYYAIQADITLLHNDSDFDLIASQSSLKASRI